MPLSYQIATFAFVLVAVGLSALKIAVMRFDRRFPTAGKPAPRD